MRLFAAQFDHVELILLSFLFNFMSLTLGGEFHPQKTPRQRIEINQRIETGDKYPFGIRKSSRVDSDSNAKQAHNLPSISLIDQNQFSVAVIRFLAFG